MVKVVTKPAAKPAGPAKASIATVRKTAPVAKQMKARGSPSDDPDEPRMVYVKGIPFKAEWQELKDHMKQAGEVEFASILANEVGRSKGIGCVRYSTVEEAQNAISSLNGSEMMNKTIEVDAWTGPKPSTNKGGMATSYGGKGGKGMQGMQGMFQMLQAMMGGTGGNKGGFPMMKGGKFGKGYGKNVHGEKESMIYVTNLARGVEWQELKDHCKQVGTVEFVNIMGKSGQVRFSSAEEAQAAIAQLNGTELMGQTIEVDVWN